MTCPSNPNRLLIASAAFVAALAAQAPAAILTYSPNVATARGDANVTIGTLFQVGANPIDINRLGVQDADAANDAQDPDGVDGLTGFADDDGFLTPPISVGLWNAAGTTLLASATVTNSDPYIGGWRYAPMSFVLGGGSSVTLAAGTQYLIGARVGAGIEWFLDSHPNPAPFAADTGITIIQNRFAGGVALTAPTSNGTGVLGRWGAANAIFIPAPAALPAGLALLALAVARRRRR